MTPLHFSLTVNPLLSPPSLLIHRAKVLEKNKPQRGLIEDYGKLLDILFIT